MYKYQNRDMDECSVHSYRRSKILLTMFRLVLLGCLLSGTVLGETPGENLPTQKEKYTIHHNKLNWYQAVQFCNQVGKRLATFNTEAEYDQLVTMILKNENGTNDNYWTAGSDLGEWGNYVWLTTGKPLAFTKWWPNEPNHDRHNPPDEEHCIDLRSEYNYYMNDNRCIVKNYFVCETIL